ncbi:alpha/beta fold hydrolase [Moritella sp. Urea-trap-13]|uniref:alpha/beta fold hydrolase n=1 Tax=Moritella sp. Urea-trap-13 TaxID=2058327 RepID=UPI000C333C46|nr:alpha/beta fold hydrolase [Moritella sp. Urea-trap-13]PKH04801.1 alpha/beta hydrolase [Moritella sp. Urea-trap-13]
MSRLIVIGWLSFMLLGCGQLLALKSDLKLADELYEEITVSIDTPATQDKRYIVIQLSELDADSILTVNAIDRGSEIKLPSFFKLTNYIFVFEDENLDFTYQINEPSYLYDKNNVINNHITISDAYMTTVGLAQLADLAVLPLLELKLKPELVGNITTWDDPAFSDAAKAMGMWQPMQFIQEDYVGIFFLAPYDKHKIPVLYVHGMGGSGKDFQKLIAQLDTNKYQAWVVNYPSALSLTLLSQSIAGMMTLLQDQYHYKPVHIVAHSMGGVLTQRYLNVCNIGARCGLIRSFTSIASPFGGVASAESGVERSPVVMPAWRDIAPNSPSIKNLFTPTVSDSLPPHLLLFTYRQDNFEMGASSDGTIALSSQLTPLAQQQAQTIYGFNYGHIDVLDAADVFNTIQIFWSKIELKSH